MGAIITRREYTNEFRPEKTSWLLGNVGDKISLELDLDVEISTDSSFSNPYESDGVDTITQNVGHGGPPGRAPAGQAGEAGRPDWHGGPAPNIYFIHPCIHVI